MATPLPLCHRCKAADMINDNINPISQGAVPVKNVLLAIALVIFWEIWQTARSMIRPRPL